MMKQILFAGVIGLFLTLIGTGKFLASSVGPVIFVEPPFRADPDALLGWADCPSPSVHYDHNWMAQSFMAGIQGMFGRESGEERQYDFTGAGTILMINAISPGIMRQLTNTLAGLLALTISVTLYVVAFVLIKRITKVET